MTRDPRYDLLFEPVRIGPVTAKNRFYQVPHCSGMGYTRPQTLNRAREINAEGGWAVVCTEYCSIHPSANDDPHPQCTLWDENDVKTLADMTDRVHRHGALAGVELWYGGYSTGNRLTRENSLAPSSMPAWDGPTQTQAMDRTDIRNLRRWHREAALRAKRAGFDIVYVYAAHGYLPAQFLSPVENRRTDEYGGSFENRARLIRELLEDTKDAVGDTCGVAFRFAVDNLDRNVGITHDGDGRALVEYLAEVPDLWDVNVADFEADARTSRFVGEAAQERYISFVKQVTTKPVVGVGRFTSPDTMAGQIRRGVLDLIGAARPAIAESLPAPQDRRKPDRRHPRMHRLQHLHLGQWPLGAHALHPEPDPRRGVATRLAPGRDPQRPRRRERAGDRRRSGGSGGGTRSRSSRLSGHAGRVRDGAGRPGDARERLAGPERVGQGA